MKQTSVIARHAWHHCAVCGADPPLERCRFGQQLGHLVADANVVLTRPANAVAVDAVWFTKEG
eukprot:scaffold35523_cov40-Prasinocladus_malaysianus.AAC.2